MINATRNGNILSISWHGSFAESFDDGERRKTESFSGSSHDVFRLDEPGAEQVFITRQRDAKFESGCGGPPQTCVGVSRFVYANGAIRRSTFEVTCNPT
jgi:hypothetical protein